MKKSTVKKLVSGLTVLSLTAATLPFNVFAASDVTGHWAESYMNKLVSQQVFTGDPGGALRPDDKITRAEFITLINNVFGFVEKDAKTFSDVSDTDWFLPQMQKAVAAGYVSGNSDGTAAPNKSITRQDAFSLLWRAAKLPAGNGDKVAFEDSASIDNYAIDAISELIQKDVISGYPDGTINPKGNITRAEASTLVSRFAGDIYSKAGTYQGAEGKVFDNVVINTPNVQLKDATINGDLYIAPGVAEGDASLENVTVKGDIFVQGGGANTVHIKGCSAKDIKVMKANNKPVRLLIENTSKISSIDLESAATIDVRGTSTVGDVDVIKGIDAKVLFEKGAVISNIVTASDITVNGTKVAAGKSASVASSGYTTVDGTVNTGSTSTGNSSNPSGSGSGSTNTNSDGYVYASNVVIDGTEKVNPAVGTEFSIVATVNPTTASSTNVSFVSDGPQYVALQSVSAPDAISDIDATKTWKQLGKRKATFKVVKVPTTDTVVTITATSLNNASKSDTYLVKFINAPVAPIVTSVSVLPGSPAKVEVGQELKFRATVNTSNGVATQGVTWQLVNGTVGSATEGTKTADEFTVTGLTTGAGLKVIATSRDNTQKFTEVELEVVGAGTTTPKPVEDIVVSSTVADKAIEIGESATFTAKCSPDGATNGAKFLWVIDAASASLVETPTAEQLKAPTLTLKAKAAGTIKVSATVETATSNTVSVKVNEAKASSDKTFSVCGVQMLDVTGEGTEEAPEEVTVYLGGTDTVEISNEKFEPTALLLAELEIYEDETFTTPYVIEEGTTVDVYSTAGPYFVKVTAEDKTVAYYSVTLDNSEAPVEVTAETEAAKITEAEDLGTVEVGDSVFDAVHSLIESGFTVTIDSTSAETIVNKDGEALAKGTANLVFTVTNDADATDTAKSGTVKVTVEEKPPVVAELKGTFTAVTTPLVEGDTAKVDAVAGTFAASEGKTPYIYELTTSATAGADNAKFKLDKDTGVLTLKEVLITGTYKVEVIAKDSTTPTALTKVIAGEVTIAKASTGAFSVTGVKVVDATTLQVELATAPTTTPVATDFNVVAAGSSLVVSSVAKVPNTTKSYNLTVPTQANKEGSLTINGFAVPTIVGSDFAFDFKAPTLVSVTATDSTHVTFVFSEKLAKSTVEAAATASILAVTESNGTTALTPKLQRVQADGKSIAVTLTTAMVEFPNGYIAKALSAVGLTDAAGNQLASNAQRFFDGVGTASTTGPIATSATYDSGTGKITVVFDKEIGTTIDKSKIQVAGLPLVASDTAVKDTVGSVTNLVITLSAATKTSFEAAATQNVAFVVGSVVDMETTPNSVLASTVSVVAAAKVTSATYNEETNILVLDFSKPVKVTSSDPSKNFDPTKINLNNVALSAVGTGVSTVKIAETGNSSKLTIDLTNTASLSTIETTAVASRSLTITAAGINVDVNNNQIAGGTYTSVLTYTSDATAPTIVSAGFNTKTGKLTVVLSEEVKIPDSTKVAVYGGSPSASLFTIDTVTPAAAYGSVASKTLVYTLGATEIGKVKGVTDKSTLKFVVAKDVATTMAITDIAGNSLAKTADVAVPITYLDIEPVSFAAVIAQIAADKIELTFNKQVAPADAVDLSKYKVVVEGASPEQVLPLVGTPVLSSDGKNVILTLDKNSSNYENTYKYIVSTTVKDVFGNNYVAAATPNNDFILNTSKTASAYALTGVKYEDTSSDFKFGAGDKLTLTFAGSVSISGDIVKEDFVLTNVTLGTGFTVVQGATSDTLVLTLGNGAKLNGTNTIPDPAVQTIDLAALQTHIMGANGVAVVAAATAPGGVAIGIPKADGVDPILVSAKYMPAATSGSVSVGDQIQLEFSEPVTIPAATLVSATDFTFTGGGAGTEFDGATATVDSTGKIVTLTVSKVVTPIVPGTTTITGAVASTITDKWGNLFTVGTAVTIAKSETVKPTVSKVQIVKGAGKTGLALEDTDKVVITFSEPVGTVPAVTVMDKFAFYQGATPLIHHATNGTVAYDGATKTATITIAASDNWIGADISTLATFNLVGSYFQDANANVVSIMPGFGIAVTQ